MTKLQMLLGILIALFFLLLVVFLTSYKKEDKLRMVAESSYQWASIAISQENRIFVGLPSWKDDITIKVGEVINEKVVPYPNNSWNLQTSSQRFNAVQSVYIDDKNRLWVVETNNPLFKGIQEEGPKLYQFNLKTNELEKTIVFANESYRKNSYFNSIRVDTEKEIAYVTDTGEGAILIVDLSTGYTRRTLETHESTYIRAEELKLMDQEFLENMVDTYGLVLSKNKDWLYYIALNGEKLYKIETKYLLDESVYGIELESKVFRVNKIPEIDGVVFDKDGNLWLEDGKGMPLNALIKNANQPVLEGN